MGDPGHKDNTQTMQHGVPAESVKLYPFDDRVDEHQIPRDMPATSQHFDAIVIGASWAGIWSLHKLQELGLRIKLVDACSDVGGVWHYTRYPGCRVDTEIPYYEFSKPSLWQKWNWSERFPSRAEIHRYLSWVCEELDLKKNMIFNTRIVACDWDEERVAWNLTGHNGSQFSAQFILPCAGYSTIRHTPELKGLPRFKNKFHSSAWPEDLHYAGKRVGVIGTAASGLQIIETISKEVEHLTVFQRTPNLATPMKQILYSEAEMRELKETYPRRFAARVSQTRFENKQPRLCNDDSPAEREVFFEELWSEGGLAFWLANYEDMLTDPVVNARAYAFWRNKVRSRIHDPRVAEILAPIKPPHAFGVKRASLESGYFEVFNQPNVTLVDVNSDPIVEVTEDGITTASGDHHKLDILALATGFDFISGSMLAMNIRGKGGKKLNDHWNVRADREGGILTHLGITTAGFPNMFFPMGPQAPSALGFTPQMAEIQGDWIADCIGWMLQRGYASIEPVAEAELGWQAETMRAADESLFSTADSWYMGVNIPGRKKQPLCYFGGVDKYIQKLAECAKSGYTGFALTGKQYT